MVYEKNRSIKWLINKSGIEIESIEIGKTYKLCNLNRKPELNGLRGYIIDYVISVNGNYSDNRYTIKLNHKNFLSKTPVINIVMLFPPKYHFIFTHKEK